MKIAYLVFAYKNPTLLERIIEKLSSPDSGFFVHIDRKSNLDDFSRIRGENIFFSEQRLPVYWAEFSGIEAILLLIRQALAAPQHYDYLVLLSGSEYPLGSPAYIQRFFEENRGMEFINLLKMPAPGKPLSRITTLRFPSTKPVLRFATKALAKLGFAQRDYRKYLGTLEPYSGITWWTLSREACQYIVDFVAERPQYSRFFHNVFAPEETFFHTILGNSSFKSRVRRNLLYEDWSARGAHPAMISDRHLAFFEGQEKVCVDDLYGPGEVLFARKFSDEGLDLLQRMDGIIGQSERRLARSAQAPLAIAEN